MTAAAETLTEFDKGFNAGIAAACEYHETIARIADKAASAIPHLSENASSDLHQLSLQGYRVMGAHREHANHLRGLKKQTDAEKAEYERLERHFDR